jgi:hypothetical protein
MKGKKNAMSFSFSMIWREPNSHLEDCYLFLTKIKEHSKKSKGKMRYTSLPLVMKPMPHGDQLPVSRLPSNWEDFTSLKKNCRKDHVDPVIPVVFSSVIQNHI